MTNEGSTKNFNIMTLGAEVNYYAKLKALPYKSHSEYTALDCYCIKG